MLNHHFYYNMSTKKPGFYPLPSLLIYILFLIHLVMYAVDAKLADISVIYQVVAVPGDSKDHLAALIPHECRVQQ